MKKIEDLFKLLSQEKKLLKPDHAYKPAEEGLLRAFYFFRWLNKKDYGNLDRVVEAFAKNKVPEQQIEHYGCALVMIDYYETEKEVKEALLYINDQFKEKTGSDILFKIKDKRVERRVLKNVYKIFNEARDTLANRTQSLKKSSISVWVFLFVFLAINIILVGTGVYYNFLMKIVPSLMADSKIMEKYGVAVLAGILFIIPALIIILVSRYKLTEQVSRGNEYPELILKLNEGLDEFKQKLEAMKINVDQGQEV